MAIEAVTVTTLDSSQTMAASSGEKTMMKDEMKPFALASLFKLRLVSLGDSAAIIANVFLCSQMFWSLATLLSQSISFEYGI